MWIWLILIPVIIWQWKPITKLLGALIGFWLKALIIFLVVMVVISVILISTGVIKGGF